MPELLSIGEVARRAHVPASAIRYYERRGLLDADARQSGQRRYRTETLRRLVFIGMMQDIGLTLDEVRGILNAATAADWKSIAGQRLTVLDEQIAQLQHARALRSWADVSGRRRRVYGLTDRGAAALATEQAEWRRFAVGVQAVVGWSA